MLKRDAQKNVQPDKELQEDVKKLREISFEAWKKNSGRMRA